MTSERPLELEEIPGIVPGHAQALREAGFETTADLQEATADELDGVELDEEFRPVGTAGPGRRGVGGIRDRSILLDLLVEAVEHELQVFVAATASFAETVADVERSAERLCNSRNPERSAIDRHLGYLWDLVHERRRMAESAERAFSLLRTTDVEFEWNAFAFHDIVEQPDLAPHMGVVEGQQPIPFGVSGDLDALGDAIELNSSEDVRSFLGVSTFEEVPASLEADADELEASLRETLENITYDQPCFDEDEIVLTGGDDIPYIACAEDKATGKKKCVTGTTSLGELLAGAVIAAVIAAAVGVIVGIVKGFKKLFDKLFGGENARGRKSRDLILETDEEILALADTRHLKMLLFEMMNDGTGNKQERAILKVLRAIGCDRARDELFFDSDVPHRADKSVPDKHGNWLGWIYNTMSGSEKNRFIEFLVDCYDVDFPESPSISRNDIRNFIEHANCGTLSSLSHEEVTGMLQRTLDGHVGNRRERAIIKLFECMACDRVRRILSEEGLGRHDFEEKVQGSEWDRLHSLFSVCEA